MIGQCPLTVFLVGKLKCVGGRPRVSGETAWPRGGVEDGVRNVPIPHLHHMRAVRRLVTRSLNQRVTPHVGSRLS